MKNLIFVAITLFASSAYAKDWTPSYQNDEMRGTAQKFSTLGSENSAYFDFPYDGGSELSIVLRSKKTNLKDGQKPEGLIPAEAMLLINKGPFLCNSYDDCHVSVKFGQNKIKRYSMNEATDGSADVIFFSPSSDFIKNIKSHKQLIIEVEFYQEGKKQFKFNIDNYPW